MTTSLGVALSVRRFRNGLQIIGEASDGREAVAKAEKLQPDLILLDVGLPKLNGIEAARHIRKLSPHSTILFVSLHASADVVRAAQEVTFSRPMPEMSF